MDDIARGLAIKTRRLDMEVLCMLPPGGNQCDYNRRTLWERGANIAEMQQDLVVGRVEMRAALAELAERFAVKTGRVAPVGAIRGGDCAFIEPRGWKAAEAACEAYLEEVEHG
jgi:hypothetical protein